MSESLNASSLDRIEQLTAISIELSTEKDTAKVLDMILDGARMLTGADGGVLCTLTENKHLKVESVRVDSLGFRMGGSSGEPIPFEPVALFNPDGSHNMALVATSCANSRAAINIADVYAAEGYDFSETRAFDQRLGYRSQSFLTIPMKNHLDDIIGVLQLINATDPLSGEVVPFSSGDQRLVMALASQASVALTQKHLIEGQKQLFDSLIRVIATAIDEKSRYTGGHCSRVPIITMMLADAASACSDGPLKDFTLDENGREELRISAWLHDCGKIATPEHIMDKATKLETINDRIELVETRFEIIRRDMTRVATGGSDAEQSQREQLEEDLQFLKRCNVGMNFMVSQDIGRVKQIARSYCWESVAGERRSVLTEDELQNLTIPKGTLTDAECGKINDHVVVTTNILKSLALPAQLRNIPDFAGAHHERLDGKGYPARLTKDEIPMQARIMAVADIFEALTAADRPYKKGNSLSEALKIMRAMANEGHIDPDLFRLFLEKEIDLRYAQQYLPEEMIDHADRSGLMSEYVS